MGENDLSFGLAFGLQDNFSSGAAGIQSAFNKLQSGANSLAAKIDDSMSRIYKGFGQVAAGVGLLLPLKSILSAFIEYDNLERGMTAVTGSIKTARDEIIRLKEVAKLPGLGMQEAISLSTQLQAASVSADLARRSLLSMGNALASVGKGRHELMGTVEALRKIATNGVNGMYINQISKRVPQFVGVLKNVFGTAIPKEISKMGYSGIQFIEKVTGELLKLKRVDQGIGNGIENMLDALWLLKVSFGKTIAPFVESLANSLSNAMSTIERFAGTTIGAALIKFTSFGLALLGTSFILRGLRNIFGGLGGVISAFGGSLSFIGSALTFKIKSLVTTFGKLATMGKAFIIANPVAVAFLAIGAAIAVTTKAMTAFDDFVSGKTKLADGWVKFGGIIQGISAIFSSITNDGWSMSEELYLSLQKIGVLDTVRSIGTWVVRLRALWQGFSDTFSTVFSAVKEVVISTLGKFGIHLDKLSSNLDTWRTVGIIAGVAIVGILGAVVVAMLAAAASAVVAGAAFLVPFLPFIALGILIGGALYLIWKGLGMIWDAGKWAFEGLVKYGAMAWDWLSNIGKSAYNWGANFVNNLWNGIKAIWTNLANWISEKWNNIAGMFGGAYNMDLNTNTNTTETRLAQPYQSGNTAWLDNMATRNAQTKAVPLMMALSAQPAGKNSTVTTKSEILKSVNVNLNLDGRTIHRSVNDASEFDEARTGN